MKFKEKITVMFCAVVFSFSVAQPQDFDYIISSLAEDLYEQDASIDTEQIENDLRDMAEHPLNLNNTDTRSLERLPFLSDDQILEILLYAWKHPFQSIEELKLVYGIDEYTLRLLMPFVCVVPEEKSYLSAPREWFAHTHHDLVLRTDARSLTTFKGDPFYANIRYRINAGGHFFFDVTAKRNAGEAFNARSRYGAAVELRDVRLTGKGLKLSSAVIGDYRACFGMGLVMNSAVPYGKSGYAAKIGYMSQGLRRYGGTSNDFLRGAGATLEWKYSNISVFYSLRSPDSLSMHHTIGANYTWQKNRLSIGLTAVEDILSDSLKIRNNYYNGNYFRGERQFSASFNARYAFRRVFLLGEAAVSQNDIWGVAVLAGVRYVPVQDVQLLALYRFYSQHYDALHASTFSETSRPNDEHGGYIGADITRLRNWRFSLYGDMFAFSGPKYTIRQPSFGYDWMIQTEYSPSDSFFLTFRARNRRKGGNDNFWFRVAAKNNVFLGEPYGGAPFTFSPVPTLSFRTQADFTIARKGLDVIPYSLGNTASSVSSSEPLSFGVALTEQAEYRFRRVPIVMQGRVTGFYIPKWQNRIYLYENDVLYAFSVPSVYGVGVRAFLNIRYRISEHWSLYMRLSDTWYTKQWTREAGLLSSHKPDIHLMVKISI